MSNLTNIIQDVRVNDLPASATAPLISGLLPLITWNFSQDIAAPSQNSVEIRIGDDETNWGYSDFAGNILTTTLQNSSNNFQYNLYNLSRGILYFCQVRATDADMDVTAWTTFSFKINQLPYVINYYITPTNPTPADELELHYTYIDFDHHDEFQTKIRWYKNNIPQIKYDNLCTIGVGATLKDDSWTAKIIPSDGMEYGPIAETPAVIIADLGSSVNSVYIYPIDANVDDILYVDYSILENEYGVTDGTPLIEWYINDILVENSNQQYIRLSLEPDDIVFAIVNLVDGQSTLSTQKSQEITISDVSWHIYDLEIDGLKNPTEINDLTPNFAWKIYKSTAEPNDVPNYYKILITTTPSLDEPVYDSGFVEYTNNSYNIPSGYLFRGKQYFAHVGIFDSSDLTNLENDRFVSVKFSTSGSSWFNYVDNSVGWTIEFKAFLNSTESTSNFGVYIHDGTYFCSIVFGLRTITFTSKTTLTYKYADSDSSLLLPETFKIIAKSQDLLIYKNNKLVLDATGIFNNISKQKFIEYGDIDGKNINSATFRFFRYSTNGPYGMVSGIVNENNFVFSSLGKIKNGNSKYLFDNIISWLPDDTSESAKLIKFNENSKDIILPTVNQNYSPITAIHISNDKNIYIGSANGVTAIFGEKHDPDYEFSTSGSNIKILSKDFDRITTVESDLLSTVEESVKTNWFTINTTYRAVLDQSTELITINDPYNPYLPPTTVTTNFSHAIHYYTQRTHGHAWFDLANNNTGWQITFSLQVEKIEADDYKDDGIQTKSGFGVYVNDGTNQEIIYFYEDRIRLYYANVFVPLNTKNERDYVITGKANNIKIYQRLTGSSIPYFLIADGSGLFTTPAAKTGNSRKPKIIIDKSGFYHTVWQDDSNKRSQLFYSKFDGSSWSNPELILETDIFNIRNPNLDIDDLNRVWVCYEDTSWGPTEISVSVKDEAGWNSKTRITNNKSNKSNPVIKIDIDQNAHVLWADNRYGLSCILWAEYKNDKKAWFSSAQFDVDTIAMEPHVNDSDPYTNDLLVEFKNPQACILDNKLWIVAEGFFPETGYSVIYRGFRDLETKVWNTSGAINLNTDGEFTSVGSSIATSDLDKFSFNPSISSNEKKKTIVIAWEDRSEIISQIYGIAINNLNAEITSTTKLTNHIQNCKTPVVGWASDYCMIVFEKNGTLYTSYYDGVYRQFFGSAIGGEDRNIITDDDNIISNPAISQYSPSETVKIVYDFKQIKDPAIISTTEIADFYRIGCVNLQHYQSVSNSTLTTTTTINENLISNIDTKEFAFGDFSENVGIMIHWKDISMYFGHDAKPYNIIKYNTNTVLNWPDNRINDLFVDIFGNLIVGTFGGLLYHNIFTGKLTNIRGYSETYSADTECSNETCLLSNKLVTAVKWGKNGIWYVGTTTGIFYSQTAGRVWKQFFPETLGNKIVHSIAVDSQGRAIVAAHSSPTITTDGILVLHPDMSEPIIISTQNPIIKTLQIDENDVIWAGSDSGIIRIEDFNTKNMLTFGRNSGMRCSHVNDITIVNKNLRYIATASGIERMFGTKFSTINVTNTSILNDNISCIKWDSNTNSLWIGSLYSLYQIVFRDINYEIIENEIVKYDNTEISTENNYDKKTYTVLDYSEIQSESSDQLFFSQDSVKVFVNKNEVEIGHTIDESSQSVLFLCDMLPNDQVEVQLSNRFIQDHDFDQSSIEKDVVGEKRTDIIKIDKTSKNQLLFLSAADKPSLLIDGGRSSLPFTTMLLDRDLPIGCIQKTDTITQNVLRFKILAFDKLSGIDGMILSNYENFTTNGTTEQSFTPFSATVDHNIGLSLTNITDSLEFEETTTIDNITFSVGTGSHLCSKFDELTGTNFLYAATSSPIIIFKYDPVTDEWSSIQAIDHTDQNSIVTEFKNINNTLWLLTGSDFQNGRIYRSINGDNFDLISNITGTHARGIASSVDGTIYIGSSDAKIYKYTNSSLSVKYQNIGESIYSLSMFANNLIVGTGNKCRIYVIDTDTDNELIVFDGTDNHISNLHIKNPLLTTSLNDLEVFASSGTSTTIYKSQIGTYDFIKSYASAGKTISTILEVETKALTDPQNHQSVSGTTIISAIGTDLFKFNETSWEFVYRHSGDIGDIEQYFSKGIDGIWLISDKKITKWTADKSTKTVFLKLKDKAGNYSAAPSLTDEYTCPNSTSSICCGYAYSINISDLQNFVNESRIVDVSEYGEILFTYDSVNNRPIYSADQIDEEVGIYTSEVFNGTNELVSWKSVAWESTEPYGTKIIIQIRYGPTEDECKEAEWSLDLSKNSDGIVSIEHITDQYLQFRIILTSSSRNVSPSLTSVTIRNLTAEASHFFTTNFVLPSKPIKGLLTANTFIPVTADIIFGINTKNTTDFADYQIIEPNRLFTLTEEQFGNNLRIGAKLLSPIIPQISETTLEQSPYFDEYTVLTGSDIGSYSCIIQLNYMNQTTTDNNYHFRIRFYNDVNRTQLSKTFFTGNDQTGWRVESGENHVFPANGILVPVGTSVNFSFTPGDQINTEQKWYIIIDSYNGSVFETISDNYSFICPSCNITYELGLITEYFKLGTTPTTMPTFSSERTGYSVTETQINFNETTSDWITTTGQVLTGYTTDFALKSTGKIQIPYNGVYTFRLESTDGSILFINNEEIINHDGVHSLTSATATASLVEGYNNIEIQYFNASGSAALKLYWILPGDVTETIVPSNRLYHVEVNEYCDSNLAPKLFNLALIFETENHELVKLNLT